MVPLDKALVSSYRLSIKEKLVASNGNLLCGDFFISVLTTRNIFPRDRVG